MNTQTDTPRIVVGSFEPRDEGIYLRAKTSDGVEVKFLVDPIALAVMSLTMDGALRVALATLKAEGHESPQPPAAPDSPEGLG